MARRTLNRLSGRVFGWFESKDAEPVSAPLPAQFTTRARLAVDKLEDRVNPVTFNVTTLADSATIIPGSLRDALTQAYADAAADVITFDAALFVGGAKTIDLALALPAAGAAASNGDITITGPAQVGGENQLTIRRAANAATSFSGPSFANPNAVINVNLSQLNFSNFTGVNGLLLGNENTVMDKVNVTDNGIISQFPIWVQNVTTVGANFGPGQLTMTNSRISGNSTTASFTNAGGGAIYAGTSTKVTLISSVISGNTIVGQGGAIFARGGNEITVTDSVIENNRSSSDGGGIYFYNGGSLNVTRSTISGNQASEEGGAIYFYGTVGSAGFNIINSTITNNVGRRGAGGLLFRALTGNVNIANSTIVGNTTRDSATSPVAGAISVTSGSGTVTIDSVIFQGNDAPNTPAVSDADLSNTPANFIVSNSALAVDPGFGLGAGNLAFGSNLDLGPLVSVGGKPASYSLGAASAAIDTGSTAISGTGEDQNGTIRPQGSLPDIGSYERVLENPEASVSGLTTISTAGGGPTYSFTVVYDNNTESIDLTSLGNDDIRVTRITGPAGFTNYSQLATLVSATPGAGKSVTAVYTIPVPGGSFDAADNGVFRFVVEPNSVKSTPGGFFSPNVAIGDLTVGIAQTFTVTNLNDSGTGSLREAFNNVNVVPSNDTIVFDAGLFTGGAKFINLASRLPVISDSVTVTGPGSALLTVRRELGSVLAFNIFNFVNPVGASTVNISGVTLANGSVANDGGGLFAGDETVSLTDVTLSGNTGRLGGGVFSLNGKLSIDKSTISSNRSTSQGGGVYNGQSVLTITNSTIDTNIANNGTGTARGGGGIMLFGNLPVGGVTIENSTISGNSSPASGGGIEIFYSSGLINLRNLTITNNKATGVSAAAGKGGGGIAIELASNVVGGVTVNIDSTILSGNTATAAVGAQTFDLSNVGTGVTLNISKSAVGVDPATTFSSPNGANLSFADSTPAALVLGTLAGNGGTTKTHAIGFGSKAIDAGSNLSSYTNDQRGVGFPRSKAAGPDIGAFENQGDVPSVTGGPYATVTAASNPTTYTFTVTYSSSQSLINVSSINTGDITVTGPNGFSQVATFVSAAPNTNSASIVATYSITAPGGTWDGIDNGTYTIAINANQVSNTAGNFVPASNIGTFLAQLPITVVVTNTNDTGVGSFRQAVLDTNANAGAADFITFDPTVFATAKTIQLAVGSVTINDSVTITGPTAGVTLDGNNSNRLLTISGAGILSVNLSNMTLTKGSSGNGGAIANADENLTLTKVTITGNTASGFGGGLYTLGGTTTLINSTVSSNTAGTTSGGIDVVGTLVLTGSTVSGNSAGLDGGGIYVNPGSRVVATESTISGNTASENGGGIFFYDGGSLLLERSTISGNTSQGLTAPYGGGGIYFAGAPTVDDFIVSNSTISGNTTLLGTGAGIFFRYLSTVTATNEVIIRNSTITANSAENNGGGIAVSSPAGSEIGDITLTSSIVSGNSSGFVTPVANDVFNSGLGIVTTSFSALGVPAAGGFADGGNNLPDGSVLNLQPLANNGGLTQTHALGAGSLAINAGSNPAALTTDQRGGAFTRTNGQADIGSFEVQAVGVPAVTGFVVNQGASGGATQRSRITTIVVTFASSLTPANITALQGANIIRLINAETGPSLNGVVVRTGGAGSVLDGAITVTAGANPNEVILTFAGAAPAGPTDPRAVDFGSLSDGRWRLEVDTTPGGAPEFVSDGSIPAQRIRRLFGDINGDGNVDGGTDSASFAIGNFQTVIGLPAGTTTAAFDFNNDGTIDGGTDFAEFGTRFGRTV